MLFVFTDFVALFADKYRNLHTFYVCDTSHRKKNGVLRNLHSAHVVENNVR